MSVVTLGVHIVDVLTRPVEFIPEGQDTVLVDQIRITAAGAAAGTAVDLVKLGNDVVTMGAIGDDELGDFLLMVMARHGVDVSRLVRRAGEQTAASILPIRPDGGRPSFHVPGANLTVTPADVDADVLRTARAVHLGGVDVTFGLGDPAFLELLDEIRASGTIVTMDLLSEMPDLLGMAKAFLPHVDYVLPNESQALLMTGAADIETAATQLLAAGPRGVLVTLGAEGSLIVTRAPATGSSEASHAPAPGLPGDEAASSRAVTGDGAASAPASNEDAGHAPATREVARGGPATGEVARGGLATGEGTGHSLASGEEAGHGPATGEGARGGPATREGVAGGPEAGAGAAGGTAAGVGVVGEAADGAVAAGAVRVERVPAVKVEVNDTTGCGDGYCAGFITGLLHGQDVLTAARWGTAAAARVATGLGSDAGITDLASTLEWVVR